MHALFTHVQRWACMHFLLTYRSGHACAFYSRTEVGMHALFTHVQVQRWSCAFYSRRTIAICAYLIGPLRCPQSLYQYAY